MKFLKEMSGNFNRGWEDAEKLYKEDKKEYLRAVTIPLLSLGAVVASGGNLAFRIAQHELEGCEFQGAVSPACIQVDKPTIVQTENPGKYCADKDSDPEALLGIAFGIRGQINQQLGMACAFEPILVDQSTHRVVSNELALTAPHFVQHPNSSLSVTVDGHKTFEAAEEVDGVKFNAGEYVSFFQPTDPNSMDCAGQLLSAVKAQLPDLYDSSNISCRVHFDTFPIYNGNPQGMPGEAIMPVVACGNYTTPNPSEVVGGGKEGSHYSHISVMSI